MASITVVEEMLEYEVDVTTSCEESRKVYDTIRPYLFSGEQFSKDIKFTDEICNSLYEVSVHKITMDNITNFRVEVHYMDGHNSYLLPGNIKEILRKKKLDSL